MYTVVSENFILGEPGDTLASEDLGGCDIDALVQGGHLVAVEEKPDTSTAKSAKKEKE